MKWRVPPIVTELSGVYLPINDKLAGYEHQNACFFMLNIRKTAFFVFFLKKTLLFHRFYLPLLPKCLPR